MGREDLPLTERLAKLCSRTVEVQVKYIEQCAHYEGTGQNGRSILVTLGFRPLLETIWQIISQSKARSR